MLCCRHGLTPGVSKGWSLKSAGPTHVVLGVSNFSFESLRFLFALRKVLRFGLLNPVVVFLHLDLSLEGQGAPGVGIPAVLQLFQLQCLTHNFFHDTERVFKLDMKCQL